MSLGVSAQSALGATSELLKTPLCHGLGGLPFEVAKATFSDFVDPLSLRSTPQLVRIGAMARVCAHRQDDGPVGVFVGFNTSNDLFDALVFQDRLPRDCCQEVPGDRCSLPRVHVMEALAWTWLGRRLDPC